MAIKVFEITADSFLAGGARHIITLAKFLKKDSFEPIIVCPQGWLAHEAKKEKISFRECQIKSILDWASFFKLWRLIKKLRPDIIHFHGTRSGIWGIWIKFFCKIPVVYSEHLYTKDYHLKNLLREKLQLVALFLVCYGVNKIVTPSKQVKEFLNKNLKIKPEKITVVYNGLEPAESKGMARPSAKISFANAKIDVASAGQLLLKVKELKIGFIGGLNEQKGLKYLIIAMHRLVARFPKLKLEIIGDGLLRSDLEKQAVELKNNIVFLGSQNNSQKYLLKWLMLVAPSVSESFGQVALEAARAQKPVVASRVGGLSEIVIDKKTGLLIEPRKPDDLVEAISYLLLHSRVAKLMGRRAKIRFERKFTATIMASNMAKIYQNVLEK